MARSNRMSRIRSRRKKGKVTLFARMEEGWFTQKVPVVRLGADGVREGVALRWGLVPFFAHGEPPKYSTINARIETVESAASYRGPWKRGQRCLLPATGFYEWHVNDDGRKQAYYIHLADQDITAQDFQSLLSRYTKD